MPSALATWVSGRTETKTYGSAADTPAFQTLTGRKAFGKGKASRRELYVITFPKRVSQDEEG